MRLVPEAEYTTRDTFFTKAQEYGFKDADTLGKYAPIHKHFTETGRDPAQFASILGGRPQQQQNQPGQQNDPKYLTAEQVEKMLSEREAASRAEQEHEGHMKALPTKVSGKVAEHLKAAGLKPESPLGKLLTGHVMHELNQLRAMYPDGHALAGKRLTAITDDIIEKHFNEGKYGDLLKGLRGEFLSNAAAANAGVSPTAAGASGNSGATGDQKELEDKRARGIDTRTREEKESIVRRNRDRFQAGRAGATLG
jgi:hypothetical protein